MIKQEKNFSIQVPRCLICYKFDIALKSACPCIMQYIHLVQNYILVNDLDNNCENLVDYFSVRQCVIEIFLTQSLTNFHQYFTDKHLSCISNQVLGQYSFIKVGKFPQSSSKFQIQLFWDRVNRVFFVMMFLRTGCNAEKHFLNPQICT